MNRVNAPYTSITSGASVFDTDNIYRTRDIVPQLNMLNKDDGTFLKLLDTFGRGPDLQQAVYWFVEDQILGIHTTAADATNTASDTTVKVADPLLFVVNSILTVPRTLENMLVTAVDYTTAILTVTRGYQGTAGAALVLGDKMVSLPPTLAELGDANLGTGRVPIAPIYNLASMYSTSVQISDLQTNSAMVETGEGRVATMPWAVQEKIFEIRRQINKALIFSKLHTGTANTSADGQEYHTQGFAHYVKTHQLNVGGDNTNLSWPLLGGFLDETFEDTASSDGKVCVAGNYLFSALNMMNHDMSVPMNKYFSPELSQDVLLVTTPNGNSVQFIKDRHGLPAEEGLAGWGLVIDLKHVKIREVQGMPMAWKPNVQDNDAHVRKDELWGTFSLEVKHEQTCGLIRGASEPAMNRYSNIGG